MESICKTRLAKEKEILKRMESKNTKITLSHDDRSVEVVFSIFSTNVTYYINLPERYPFLPPIITVNIPSTITSLYSDSSDLLSLIIEDTWTPSINLQTLIENIALFNTKSLSQNKASQIGGLSLWAIVLISIVFRAAMYSQSYSGHYTPPLYGDYEAQRHWMELTYNFPAEMWYKDTLETDPGYWKLDYPPLTAWHSYLCGLLSALYEPESMELDKSRGYYTESHLAFMRTTVLVSEIAVYIPAVVVFFTVFNMNFQQKIRNMGLLLFLMSPPLILIDYGHFQYNNVMLGFALASTLMTVYGYYSTAAMFLALGINFKIMSLYYILPLGLLWLAVAWDQGLRERYKLGENLKYVVQSLVTISGVIAAAGSGLLVFIILWTPWLSIEDIPSVLSRIFPFNRGVFEDKVATFWCVTSTLIKYKQYLSIPSMSLLTALSTLLVSSPFLYFTITKRRLKNSIFYGLAGVSLSFFLFSYHVHEKTILVPLLPISLITIFNSPYIFQFVTVISTFSLYPLLVLDRLRMPYFIFQGLFLYISSLHIRNLENWTEKRNFMFWYLGIAFIHCLEIFEPPSKYPYLFDLIVACYSFAGFVYVWVFLFKEHKNLNDLSSILNKINKDKTR